MSAPVKKCEVTPLEALRRLYDVARKVDASESGELEQPLQEAIHVAYWTLAAAPVVPVAAQPVVQAPIDWKDRLYVAMDAEFALREGAKRDEDGQRMGMVIDDTQVGVEFAMSWFEKNMPAAPSHEAQPAGEVERDAARYRFFVENFNLHFTASDAIYDRSSLGPSATITDAIDKAMAQGEKHEQ